MGNQIKRRSFIKGTAGFTFGALTLPGAAILTNSCSPENPSIPAGEKDQLIGHIDWKEIMQDHDLIWKKIPAKMEDAPHFGNGLMGSMFWIEDNMIRLQVFRADVHDHNDESYGWSAYSRPRFQIGYFLIRPKGNITDCLLRQDIYNADLKGTINTDLGSLSLYHLVHRTDDVLYTTIECSENEAISDWQWHPYEAKTSRGGGGQYKQVNNPAHQILNRGDIKIGYQDLNAGGDYATAWKDSRTDEKSSVLLVSIENNYPEKVSEEKSVKLIADAEKKLSNLSGWIDQHRQWWHDYYPESFVTFPDSTGQTFYWTNVYRLACCTRPDAKYIDAPGMWSSGGPWPYSAHDYNTQTVHFPVYTSNRLHLGEALVETVHKNLDNLIDNVVPAEWQEDSALIPLATAFDLRGKRDTDKRYSELVGCLPWLVNNLWIHYRCTMDKEMLREKVFPILKRSINLYRHLMYEGDDGKIHLPPTYSPELENVADCNMDLALFKWGCMRLVEICEILDIEDPLIPEWKRIQENLTDYPIDENGYMMGRDKTGPINHRHMSHLMMIYPLYIENIDNTQNYEVLAKSVKLYEPTWAVKMGASQSSPVAAALGFGNLAHKRMNYILYKDLYTDPKFDNTGHERLGKNGMYYLATPCIETSLSYNTCVQDMLLQSWGNKIRVFPALPDVWQKEVAFHKFRAEGAFLVSASRKNGKTEFVKIKSLAGEPCVVIPTIEGKPGVISDGRIKLKEISEGCYEINLKKGEEITLYDKQLNPEFTIDVIPMEEEKKNYFGMT